MPEVSNRPALISNATTVYRYPSECEIDALCLSVPGSLEFSISVEAFRGVFVFGRYHNSHFWIFDSVVEMQMAHMCLGLIEVCV